ncbi:MULTISPECIES: V-type ATP synthase subunit I [unclassified Saccharicrinis]|uniref:V-type ATP synthase subunit I n=1 Tax=unclassified Saccharicrinis TaxID=2646859 RepID=UPI003D34A69C
MFKYSFLVHHADFSDFKGNLKERGVLHVEERDIEPGAEIIDYVQLLNEIKRYQKSFISRKEAQQDVEVDIPQSGIALIDMVKDKNSSLEALRHEKQHLIKEVDALNPWGNFSWKTIQLLKNEGIETRFFYCSAKKYQTEWESQYSIAKINEDRGFVYFVFYDNENQSIELDADEIKIPKKDLSAVQRELKLVKDKIQRLEKELDFIAEKGKSVLDEYEQYVQDKLNDANFISNANEEAEGKIKIIEGWVPESKDEEFEAYLKNESVYYLRAKSSKFDKAPVLLKNGRFSKLFEPIGKLFSLPTYAEIDLTPFFAPFFFLFFGFCFGDAGYGLLFVLVAGIAKYKVSKDMKPILSLVQWLGAAAVLFGAITGTFFGIKLMNVDIPFFSRMKESFLTDEEMFNLALLFGFVQILFGMAIKVANEIRQEGWKYSLSAAGWFLFFISTAVMVILDAVGGEEKWMWSVAHLILIGIAGLGIFIFNNPKGNILLNIGAGLWDTYNMVTGFAGDLLSYIRLFALGLSSAILGLVFNSLAFDLSPDIPVVGWIITAIILIFGHGLNIFMAALGSIVHPMRLTFVEFYKNAGYVGGGAEYRPFKKISK